MNAALVRLIKSNEPELERIALQAQAPLDAGLFLTGIEREGFHYLLMKVPSRRLESLTDRECEIALAAAAGLSNKEVAKRLSISPATVASHLRAVYSKLGVDSRAALLARFFSSSR